MIKIEDGGPAFPVSTSNEVDGHQDGPNAWQLPGMSLRDYLAAKAMQAMISKHGREDDNPGFFDYATDESIAKCAYIYADAMLKVRKEGT
jgi:hypothetical protein